MRYSKKMQEKLIGSIYPEEHHTQMLCEKEIILDRERERFDWLGVSTMPREYLKRR